MAAVEKQAVSPSRMESGVWVRALTRTRQRVIYLAGAWVRCLTRTCQRVDLAGVTGMRSRGWGACYASWVGCMLYHAGLPRSPAYESHPWMKGWLNVVVNKLICNMSCVHVTFQAQVGAFDGELLMAIAMLAYACVLVGLSVGYADRATIPPHSSLSSMKWRRTGGVHPRSATFSRDHLCMSLWIPAARPRTFPWPPRSPPARPLALTCLRVCSRESS